MGRKLITVLALVLGAMVGAAPGPAYGEGWETLPIDYGVTWLTLSVGGVLVAETHDALLRSDDGGHAWSRVPFFERAGRFGAGRADPSDPDTMYITTYQGLQRTTDGGKTWAMALPTPSRRILRLAISPVNRAVYAAVSDVAGTNFELMRSSDLGVSWETRQGPLENDACGHLASVLVPHPTQPDRLFRSSGCEDGDMSRGFRLEVSDDGGATYREAWSDGRRGADRLVGGAGAQPTRFYLVVSARGTAADLFRSDDDGLTWTRPKPATLPSIWSLAYDPAVPDRVFIGLQTGAVWRSDDGGASWEILASPGVGAILSLVLDADGRYLYAAGGTGLARLSL